MNVIRYENPVEFWEKVEHFLLQEEVANNLLLAILTTIKDNPTLYGGDPPILLTIEDNSKVVYCALQTPPHNLVLPLTKNLDRIATLAQYLVENNIPIPGVLGFAEGSHFFAQTWKTLTHQDFSVEMHERIYELRHVNPHTIQDFEFHQIKETEIDILVQWMDNFAQEALREPPSKNLKESKQELLNTGRWTRFYGVYKENLLVSIVHKAGTTPTGQIINVVYTPPTFRNHGYASHGVARLSQLCLDQGKMRCILFTDLSNPTSNKIYQTIGYHPVIDVDMYTFNTIKKEQ